MPIYHFSHSFSLSSGGTLESFDLSYETYGKLNQERSNVILVCHALSGNARVSMIDGQAGWWDDMVGEGKPIDTNKFFVICSNVLGSCYGSTGPASIHPKTGKRYGKSFPLITICDMVHAQKLLIDSLNIPCLYAIIGSSMGGMQALEWSIAFPSFTKKILVIATTAQLSPQGLAFNSVGRHAIMSDPHWNEGNYYETNEKPKNGLGTARMIGHVTYLSKQSFEKKFGRKLQNKSSNQTEKSMEKQDYGYTFDIDFEIESYLNHQASKFATYFDANSYLYLSRATSYFDLEKENSLEEVFKNTQSAFLFLGISSDWLYPPKQMEKLVASLLKLKKKVTYSVIDSPYGHDAFLVESHKFSPFIQEYLVIRN